MSDNPFMKIYSHLREHKVTYGIVAACICYIISTIYYSTEEKRIWKEFAEKHKCIVSERMPSKISFDAGIAVGANGYVSPVIMNKRETEKTAYICNDGIAYWR